MVRDFTTKQPISGATVGYRDHKAIAAKTSVEGAFQLEQDHMWGFCWIMPGEFWAEDGLLFVEAPGYQPFEQEVYTRHGNPYIFRLPIELQPLER